MIQRKGNIPPEVTELILKLYAIHGDIDTVMEKLLIVAQDATSRGLLDAETLAALRANFPEVLAADAVTL